MWRDGDQEPWVATAARPARTSSRRPAGRLPLIAVTCAAAITLSACSTASTSSAPARSSKSSTPPRSSSATTIPPQHPVPATVSNNDLLRKNVTVTTCAAVAGGWGAKGTATDPGATPVTYHITIFFTTPEATVLDDATTTVSVQPHQTADWAASQQFATVPKMICVLRGVS